MLGSGRCWPWDRANSPPAPPLLPCILTPDLAPCMCSVGCSVGNLEGDFSSLSVNRKSFFL